MARTREGVAKEGFIPQELYAAIHERMPIPCVDVLVAYRKGIILLRRRQEPAKGAWFFIGGAVRKGERRIETAKRKVREETGLEIRIVRELGTDETLFPGDQFGHGKGTHTINTVYLAKPAKPGQKISLDKQSSAWMLLTPANLPRFRATLHPYIRKFSEKAFAGREGIFE